MAQTPDLATVESRARDLLDSRIESVRNLAHTRATVQDAAQALTEAKAADLAAYNTALRGGWNSDELRKLGFDEPDKRTRTRRTTNRMRAETSTSSSDSSS